MICCIAVAVLGGEDIYSVALSMGVRVDNIAKIRTDIPIKTIGRIKIRRMM
jgi:hypothetical protein